MIIVGEALVDLVEEADGRLDPRPGGSARNLAIAAARLGGTVSYIGGLSQDALGQRIRRELVAEGVDHPEHRLDDVLLDPAARTEIVDGEGVLDGVAVVRLAGRTRPHRSSATTRRGARPGPGASSLWS